MVICFDFSISFYTYLRNGLFFIRRRSLLIFSGGSATVPEVGPDERRIEYDIILNKYQIQDEDKTQ